MEKLLNEYVKKFDDNFPMFLFRTVSEDEIKEIIKKCIDENKPYETNLDINSNY